MRSDLFSLVEECVNPSNAVPYIVSKNEYVATELLSEIGNRYDREYFMDGNTIGIRGFIELLVEILYNGNEDEEIEKKKILQLLFARSVYNDNKVVLMHMLSYLEEKNQKSIFIFSRIEKLDEQSMNYLIFFIKHAPANLKIALYSKELLSYDILSIGDKYLKFIGNDVLPIDSPKFDPSILSSVNNEQLALLTRVIEMPFVNNDVFTCLSGGKVDCSFLKEIDKKENSGFAVNSAGFYSASQQAKEYLASIAPEYKVMYPEIYDGDALKMIADYYSKDKYYFFVAAILYMKMGEYEKVNDIYEYAMYHNSENLLLTALLSLENTNMVFEKKEHLPYYNLVYASYLINEGKYDEAKEMLIEVYDDIKDLALHDNLNVYLFYTRLVFKMKDKTTLYIEKVKQMLPEVKKLKDTNIDSYNNVVGMLVGIREDLDLPISTFQSAIYDEKHKYLISYIFDMERLAYEYMKLGNFRLAFKVASDIKKYYKYYVIPFDLVQYLYYSGEIDEAISYVNEIQNYVKKYDLKNWNYQLDAILCKIAEYKGDKEGTIKYLDSVVKSCKDDKAHYYGWYAIKCMMEAKIGNAMYAKERLYTCLKYCEQYSVDSLAEVYMALGVVYAIIGDREKAYHYATKAIQSFKVRSTGWLISMGIATGYMLSKGNLHDATSLVSNILRVGNAYGMKMVLVDYYYEVFAPIIAFAKENDIELEFIEELKKLSNKQESDSVNNEKLVVDMFGEVMVTVGNEVVQWKTKKSRELFLLYVLAGANGIERSTILDTLWKDYLYESAINNLKTTNNIIRNTLKKYGVSFTLSYINSKYILKINEIDNNLDTYNKLVAQYNSLSDTKKRLHVVNEIMNIYKDNLAIDMNFNEFVDERRRIKQEVSIILLSIVRALAKEGEYIEAKRLITALTQIDKRNDYSNWINIIDSHISI